VRADSVDHLQLKRVAVRLVEVRIEDEVLCGGPSFGLRAGANQFVRLEEPGQTVPEGGTIDVDELTGNPPQDKN